jgi:hypothetical protein
MNRDKGTSGGEGDGNGSSGGDGGGGGAEGGGGEGGGGTGAPSTTSETVGCETVAMFMARAAAEADDEARRAVRAVKVGATAPGRNRMRTMKLRPVESMVSERRRRRGGLGH